MSTKLLAADIRKYTLGREIDFNEFKKIVNLGDVEASKVLEQLIMDCHIRPSGKTGYKIVHGESRKKYIVDKIAIIEQKIREYFVILNHIKGLQDE